MCYEEKGVKQAYEISFKKDSLSWNKDYLDVGIFRQELQIMANSKRFNMLLLWRVPLFKSVEVCKKI